ncbi:CoA pyrophosphatase [Sphingomonas sp.]|uniref:CoA pyrophosphatase n=1 Tax=Sphingomonas sp. TaxID=28214 RepID=UPI00286E67F6|nr:CoA pyrophosphatase [Sphingomonas sp.]
MTIAARLRSALAAQPPAELLVGDLTEADASAAKPAAVLIAITERAEPGVILTVRRDDMRTHAGQIAFPGGRIDPGEDAVQAALREAWEELGLDPAEVAPIAAIDPYHTITGYTVTPVVGVIPPDLPLAPHEQEVADWFEAPLEHLLDPANHDRQSVLFQGARRHYYQIEWNGRRIWGATAAMLVNLARRLRW